MAGKLSIAIGLEGGDDVQRQLVQIGKTGQAAVESISPAVQKVEQSFNNLTRTLGITLASFESFGNVSKSFNELGSALSALEGSLTRVTRNMTLLGAAIAAAGLAAFKFVESSAKTADNIGEMAAGAGLTVETFQKLALVASDSGIKSEEFGRAIGQLSKQMEAAAAGSTKAAEPFTRLGVTIIDASGKLKTADQVLLAIADKFAKVPDSIDKTTIAMELFGRGGRKMVDFLNKGADGISTFGDKLAQLVLTESQVKIGDKFEAQMTIFGAAIKGAKDQLGILLAPGVGSIIEAFTENILKNFEDLGLKLKGVVKLAIEPILLDFARLFRGEQPETGFVQTFAEAWQTASGVISQAIGVIVAAFNLLRAGAQGLADIINNAFGTNVSGDALLLAGAVLKLIGVFSLLPAVVSAATAAFVVLVNGIALVSAAITAVSATIGALVGSGVIAGLTGPFVLAFAAIIAAMTVFREESVQIMGALWTALVELAVEAGKSLVEGFVEGLKSFAENPFQFLLTWWEQTEKDLLERWNRMVLNLQQRWQNLKNFDFAGALSFIPRGLEQAGKDGAVAADKSADVIKKSFLDRLKDLKDTILETFKMDPEALKKVLGPLDDVMKKLGDGDKLGDKPSTGLDKLIKQIADVQGRIDQIKSDAFKRLEENAKRAEEAIAKIDQRIKDLIRTTTEKGIQQGIIDPFTGGPMAGAEEAFEKLKNAQARQIRELEEEKKRIAEEAAQREEEIALHAARQLAAEKEKLDILRQQLAELQKLREGGGIKLTIDPKATEEQIDKIKKSLGDGLKIPIKIGDEGFDATAIFKSLTEAAQKVVSDISQLFSTLGESLKAGFQGFDATAIFKPLTDAAQEAINQISQLFSTMGQSLGAGFQGVNFSSVFQPLIDAAQQAVNQVSELFSTFAASLQNLIIVDFSGLISSIDKVMSAFNRMADAAFTAARAAAAAANAGGGGNGGSGGESPFPFAQGGLLPGRPGIDTNLGWFTAGEFVMRRDAVRQWGVEFMHAINAGLNPFAGAIPRFAEGGLVGGTSMHPVTIQFPGLPPISGLRASVDTVAELQRAAAMAQVRSGGRKPSRYS